MKATIEILCIILSPSWVSPSISGLSYMDPLVQKPLPGENPCNPLYWYPRQIPDYCYKEVLQPVTPKPKPLVPENLPPSPLPPMPLPPMPMHPAIPMPIPVPMYPMPMFPSAVPQFLPPIVPQMPISYAPVATNVMPMPMPSPYNYPYQPQQAGFVPGIPGLVSQDGGINILPFSDAYSDILEKHKQKLIRKRLQKVLDDYEDFPQKRRYRYRGRRY